MPVFEYKGYAKSGKKLAGTITAETVVLAKEKLLEKDIYPYSLNDMRSARKDGTRPAFAWLRKIPQKRILLFTESLETFLNSGFTVHDSLKAIVEQVDSRKWKRILIDIEQNVAGGAHLSDALRNHQHVFNDFYISIIEAGELSGELEKSISWLRDYLESKVDLRRNLINNMTYPGIMVALAFAVVLFLFTKVLPVIIKMLGQMRVALPLPTQILIAIVEFIRKYGLTIALIFSAGFLCMRFLMRKSRVKYFVHRMTLRLPLAGKLVVMMEMERFCTVVATMLKSGIPLPSALENSGKVVRNLVIRDSIYRVKSAVTEGSELAKIMRQQGIFPKNMIQLAHAGEQTGTLDDMFNRSAVFFQKELNLYTKSLSTLIEPVIILMLGILVGFIAVSILLPIFEMNAAIGR